MARKIWGGKKISEIIKDAENKQEQLNSIFNLLQEKSKSVNDVIQEANNKLESVSSKASEVNNILTEVKNSKQEIQQFREEISNLKTVTDELVNTNQSLVKEIKDQLSVVAGSSLSNTFEKRRDILKKSASKWFRWLLGDIIMLIIVAGIVFLELKDEQSLTTGFFLKLSLSFPFIYAAFFFHGQYKKERELEEEYAFKSAVSFSLDAYRKLLSEEINDEKTEERERFLDFITDTIKKIYLLPRTSSPVKKDNSGTSDTLDKIKELIQSIASIAGH